LRFILGLDLTNGYIINPLDPKWSQVPDRGEEDRGREFKSKQWRNQEFKLRAQIFAVGEF